MEEADVGGEGFDFGEIVRGDEDGGAVAAVRLAWRGEGFSGGERTGADAGHEGFDELVADEGVEAGKGLVQQDELRVERRECWRGRPS